MGHRGERPGRGWVWACVAAANWVCTHAVQQEEKQATLVGVNTSWGHVSSELRNYVRSQEAQLEWGLGLLHVLLSCTFLLVLRA